MSSTTMYLQRALRTAEIPVERIRRALETAAQAPRARKQRSDKGQKRGPYKPRVKQAQ